MTQMTALRYARLITQSSSPKRDYFITHDRVVTVNDHRYLIHFSDDDEPFSVESDVSLATVIYVPPKQECSVITDTWLQSTLDEYRKDDVFQDEFLQGIVFRTSQNDGANLTPAARALLEKHDTEWICSLDAGELGHKVRPGPYILIDNHLREVWRLYRDTQEVFRLTLQPGSQKDFTELRVTTSGEGYHDVAVPSRLRAKGSEKALLKDMRIAVKDNFHLRGVKTSLCNRSYYRTYPPQPETAPCIQTLIRSGCTIIGKTKLSSFGHWEEPMEYIDYQAPWNPRADGYQSPGGSSSGSAAAIASYDWLDIAIGADTAGSIMRPALWAGVFGMRPTQFAVSNTGIVPSISYLDVACFLGRDIEKCRDFASAWYGGNLPKKPPARFKQIIWPSDYWVIIGPEQTQIAAKFLQDLEKSLGVDGKVVSFKRTWDSSPPVEAGDLSLQEYLMDALGNIWYDDYHNSDDFRERHWKLFGIAPYVSPPVQKLWAACESITTAQRDEAVHRLEVFRRWFFETFMDSDTDPVFVIPIENLEPRYRDETVDTVTKPPPGMNSLFLAPVLGTPELIVPIGNVPYFSRVTGREEQLPFSVGLMTPRDTDLDLINLVTKCLTESGRPKTVLTGRSAFVH